MPSPSRIFRIDAAALADPTGIAPGPVSMLVLGSLRADLNNPPIQGELLILAAGLARDIDHHPAAGAARPLDRRDSILVPGLVNAHTHLDLTHIGPRAIPGGFMPFIDLVRSSRRQDDAGIAESVRDGIRCSLAGGVVAVGDIAGAPAGRPSAMPWDELRASPLWGVTFFEFFATGTRERASLERYAEFVEEVMSRPGHARVRPGLQPHAPYSVSLAGYREAIGLATRHGERGADLALSTHLAESPEEREFVAHGRGPQRALLERLGVWDDAILREVGLGQTSTAHLAPVLQERRFVCAHANDVSDRDIEVLARTGASVAYCPRASAYFAASDHFGPHRYRDMLAAGVNVCLGTDSIVNLVSEGGTGVSRLSTLDEMRFLFARDGAEPKALLAMATTHGARALALDETRFLLREGARPLGIVAVPIEDASVDPLVGMLRGVGAPELIAIAGS